MKTWRCFFCDEVFTTPNGAAAHFGAGNQTPSCATMRRRILSMGREIEEAAKVAEQRGYERGVREAEAGLAARIRP